MGYGVGSRVFHRLTVLMVSIMIPAGLIVTQEIPRSVHDPRFILHKGPGGGGAGHDGPAADLARLQPVAPPLPAAMPALQARTARAVHRGLYALPLVMPLSGYVRVMARGFPIELLNALGDPPLLAKNEPVAEIAKGDRATAVWGLVVLVGLHLAGSASHGLIRRDGVVARMRPPFPGRRATPTSGRARSPRPPGPRS